jgi:hypothetical protein
MTTAYVNEPIHSTRGTPVTEKAKREKRTRGEDAVPVPSHSARHVPDDYRAINGWGADLDPANRPSYPKEYPSDVKTARGEVKHRQVPHGKVHRSNEHPDLTPVFGAVCPPKGLSGLLRNYAFQYGEATNRHWMTLLMADRIDVIESLFTEAVRGRPDNYVKEKGWSAKFKYEDERSRRGVYAGVALLGVVAAALIAARMFSEDD